MSSDHLDLGVYCSLTSSQRNSFADTAGLVDDSDASFGAGLESHDEPAR